MLRRGEDSGHERPIYDYVLFNQDTVHETSPKNCSVCAIIDFAASLYCPEAPYVSRVLCAFIKKPEGESCRLQISAGFTFVIRLPILSADGELNAIIIYTESHAQNSKQLTSGLRICQSVL